MKPAAWFSWLSFSSLSLVALAFLAACAPGPVSLERPTAPLFARDYPRLYDRWTREGRILSITDFDTTLLVAATLRSPEFQSAYAARNIDLYQVKNPDQQAEMEKKAADRAGDGIGFVVQLTSHAYNATDLEPSRGLWRVALLDDTGTEAKTPEIALFRTPHDVATERYNPDLRTVMAGPLGRIWNIKFPNQRTDGQPLLRPELRRLVLRIAGPQGKLDLTWNLR